MAALKNTPVHLGTPCFFQTRKQFVLRWACARDFLQCIDVGVLPKELIDEVVNLQAQLTNILIRANLCPDYASVERRVHHSRAP